MVTASERGVALKNSKVFSTYGGEKDAVASSDITKALFVKRRTKH